MAHFIKWDSWNTTYQSDCWKQISRGKALSTWLHLAKWEQFFPHYSPHIIFNTSNLHQATDKVYFLSSESKNPSLSSLCRQWMEQFKNQFCTCSYPCRTVPICAELLFIILQNACFVAQGKFGFNRTCESSLWSKVLLNYFYNASTAGSCMKKFGLSVSYMSRLPDWRLALSFQSLCGLPVPLWLGVALECLLLCIQMFNTPLTCHPSLVPRLWEGAGTDHCVGIGNPVQCQLRHRLQGHGDTGPAGKNSSLLCTYKGSCLQL